MKKRKQKRGKKKRKSYLQNKKNIKSQVRAGIPFSFDLAVMDLKDLPQKEYPKIRGDLSIRILGDNLLELEDAFVIPDIRTATTKVKWAIYTIEMLWSKILKDFCHSSKVKLSNEKVNYIVVLQCKSVVHAFSILNRARKELVLTFRALSYKRNSIMKK